MGGHEYYWEEGEGYIPFARVCLMGISLFEKGGGGASKTVPNRANNEHFYYILTDQYMTYILLALCNIYGSGAPLCFTLIKDTLETSKVLRNF